ncbi:CBS domain-containing protein [Psychromarinibacter sp. C21-152]|uniref:CBS domain-containing protein n=1 Tax=Psychromarinibacter sediminicola TaxID=3033385 RepID=A0AAE3NQ37_9RHOB|nr:CBS domain-containing protein [Psychromarinibacter sediminicola]MDF0601453.1 CBS domain-containing protein [Psychromarinibacter sediminicola]
MLVHQILKSKPSGEIFTITPGTRVAEAAATMSEKRIGAVVVSSDGTTPDGILSERDIVRELGKRGASCLDDTVDTMMTADLVTCRGDESGEQVLGKMTEGRFRHLPVMDGQKMIGLISIGDVVKARLSELAMEKESLEGMIMGH